MCRIELSTVNDRSRNPIIIYILIWTAVNLIFLTRFPAMHTDESWLAGLSRTILLTASASSTESFFDLVPRAPHAIKLLYHLIQALFIKAAGFSLAAARMPSLLAGAAALGAFGSLLRKTGLPALAGTVLLSLNIQFIYASRFGRQEIFILLFMLLSLCALSSKRRDGALRGLLTGLPLAAACGFHPNAFIAAWPPGLLLILVLSGKRRWTEGAAFVLTSAAGAGIFILLSFMLNRGFTSDYAAFGEEVGVFDPFDVKLLGFDDFYRKIFMRVSGTYYTPNVLPVLAVAAAGSAAAVAGAALKKVDRRVVAAALLSIAGVNAGILLIGKYSAPSVVLLVPFLTVLILCGAAAAGPKLRVLVFTAAAAVLLANSLIMIHEETAIGRERFSDYETEIRKAVPHDGKTLGGLNAAFCFDEGMLLDWRNLAYLKDAGLSVGEYVRKSGIEYIIYPDEIDYIYRNRPAWNILYGNPSVYYGELGSFIDENCTLVSSFISPGYGTRIMPLRYKRDWAVRIYKIRDSFR